jgi:hypothetical protein
LIYGRYINFILKVYADNIEKINKKIEKGEAVVLTAEEIAKKQKEKEKKNLKDVDAVTTATSYFVEKWLNQLKK